VIARSPNFAKDLRPIAGNFPPPPSPRPKRIPDHERREVRRALCDSFYRFLVRCCSAGVIDETTVLQYCARHDISVDKTDLTHSGD
jgi:hypothetical protein